MATRHHSCRTAALATAILSALAIGVLHAACRAWGTRPLAATATVAIIGAAPIVLAYHSQAEVFAMDGGVAALVLCLTAANGPLRCAGRASQGEALAEVPLPLVRQAGSARRSRQRR